MIFWQQPGIDQWPKEPQHMGKHFLFFNPPSALPDGSKALLAGTETLPVASKFILAASEALLATFEALSPTSKALSAALEALHSWFWGLLWGPLSFFVAIIVPSEIFDEACGAESKNFFLGQRPKKPPYQRIWIDVALL